MSFNPNDFELTMCHLALDLSGTVRSDCIAHIQLCLLLKYNLEAAEDLQMGQCTGTLIWIINCLLAFINGTRPNRMILKEARECIQYLVPFGIKKKKKTGTELLLITCF